MDTAKLILDWFTRILAVAAVLAGPTTLIVGFLKTAIPGLPAPYYPAVSVVVGVVFGGVLAFVLALDPYLAIFAGAVAGYGTSKLYRSAKAASLGSR